jgi:NADP-dependent 3-hydroxy acid dehydrogenase YdfG
VGKYIIVGASHGIGEATAAKLISEGHQVINIARTANSACEENYTWDARSDDALPTIEGSVSGIVYSPG